ncbi:polygalacturonase, partial [Trifolium medium]|nr:polygalacturonase [Trifolium medium]
MEFIHGLYILFITLILFNYNLRNVEGRNHIHTKQRKVSTPAPSESSNEPTNTSNSSPSVPSDPYPNDPRDSSSDCIFDVRSFGAIGDGSCDDTPAFKKAWKAACAVESGILLVPENYTFKITSTIFS